MGNGIRKFEQMVMAETARAHKSMLDMIGPLSGIQSVFDTLNNNPWIKYTDRLWFDEEQGEESIGVKFSNRLKAAEM